MNLIRVFRRRPARLLPLSLLSGLLLLADPGPAHAVDYEVGPGQPLTAIGDVPWESLEAGDRVLIHWRDTPYREKWVIGGQGTATQPIVVSGVPGPNGELPVISGEDAVTPAALNFWNEERGVIKIGGSNTPPDELPSYIVIENLDVRSGRPPFGFTNDSGGQSTYADNAAAIYVEKAEHLTVRGCMIHDSGNGLFIGVNEGQTQDVLIEGNWVYNNGIEGSIYEHNSYTSALGITFQFNHYGPLRAGCDGNNLKDRSAGLVVRYNWIESGNRQLDLVDGEDHPSVVNHPSYGETFVYGNVLVEPDGAGNSQIVHYGGDSGTLTDYRKGTLYFFHNTVVSTRAGNTTLLRLSTIDERCDARNNIVYVTEGSGSLAMLSSDGVLDLSSNWLSQGWVDSHSGLDGVINDDGSNTEGTDPGFEDETGQDFHLAAGSACLDVAGPLAAAVLTDHEPLEQYAVHRGREPRPVEGPADLGAFERCSGTCQSADGSVDPPSDSGTGPGPDSNVGPGSDSGTTDPGADDGGCKCRSNGAAASTRGSALLAVLILAFLQLRRRWRTPPKR
ncbi:MAG: right-handed parallel beta-helix repeat-containing protein [bacterium]